LSPQALQSDKFIKSRQIKPNVARRTTQRSSGQKLPKTTCHDWYVKFTINLGSRTCHQPPTTLWQHLIGVFDLSL